MRSSFVAQVLFAARVLVPVAAQGEDFQYENAEQWYINLDKAIKHVNANGTITLKYSTPSEYVKARNAEAVQWPTKTDDFFPVSSHPSAH